MTITVTKPFLPPKDEFLEQVSEIFDSGILTNQGPKVKKLEQQLKKFCKQKIFISSQTERSLFN